MNASDNCCDATPLHVAAQGGAFQPPVDAPNYSLDKIAFLLDYGVDPDVRNKWGNTPLKEGAQFGNLGAISLLLDAGADVNSSSFPSQGSIPLLHGAVRNSKSPQIVATLLDNGADPNARDSGNNTAFQDAVISQEESIFVEMLLAAGGDANVPDA